MKQRELSYTALSDLFKQLALFLQGGIRLSDGLFLLADDETETEYRELLTELANSVESGSLLADALLRSRCFPAYAVGLLKIGEQVGKAEETLFSLSRYYEEQERMQKHITNTLTYPILLFMLMAVVIFVLISRVLPVFEEVYSSMGGSLNRMASALLSFGKTLDDLLPFIGIIASIILMISAIIYFVPSLRKKAAGMLLRCFGDRGVMKKINNAMFAQALAMALSSGMPIEDSISLSRELLHDRPRAVKRCDVCIESLRSGAELADALKKAELLPASACRLLSLSVKAGNSDVTMQDIAERLSEEARDATEAKVARIEPTLVIVASVLIGVILLSVMLPLINIMEAIG